MEWPRLLAYITGTVDQELLLRNEYLAAENRILRAKIKGRLQLSGGEKSTLAEIARRLGRKALAEVAVVARPDTILRWFRRLVARKLDGSPFRQIVGRPRVDPAIENLIVRMAQDNPTWGYDRIVGALTNLGHTVSDQTVGNVLRRHGISPAPKRKQLFSWKSFIQLTPGRLGWNGLLHDGSPNTHYLQTVDMCSDELEASRAQQALAATTPLATSAVNRTAKRARQPLPTHLRARRWNQTLCLTLAVILYRKETRQSGNSR